MSSTPTSTADFLDAMWANESPAAVLAAALADRASVGPTTLLPERLRSEVPAEHIIAMARVGGNLIFGTGADYHAAVLSLRGKLIDVADDWAGSPITSGLK